MALTVAVGSTAAATLLVSDGADAPQLGDAVAPWLSTSLLQSTSDLGRRAFWFPVGKLASTIPTLVLAERLATEAQVVAAALLGGALRDSLLDDDGSGRYLIPTAADAFDVRLYYSC